MALDAVFDAWSFGQWIYDHVVDHYGVDNDILPKAEVLRNRLINLYHYQKQAEYALRNGAYPDKERQLEMCFTLGKNRIERIEELIRDSERGIQDIINTPRGHAEFIKAILAINTGGESYFLMLMQMIKDWERDYESQLPRILTEARH